MGTFNIYVIANTYILNVHSFKYLPIPIEIDVLISINTRHYCSLVRKHLYWDNPVKHNDQRISKSDDNLAISVCIDVSIHEASPSFRTCFTVLFTILLLDYSYCRINGKQLSTSVNNLNLCFNLIMLIISFLVRWRIKPDILRYFLVLVKTHVMTCSREA